VTDAFLRRQSNYQVQRAPRRIVNKSITSKVANERWAIDLIDMTRYSPVVNAQRKYRFTCVDNFSGRVWARGITNRNNTAAGDSIPAALASICNEANTHPRTIQGDSEFAVGGIAAWCRAHNIKVIKTLTYTPQSNGKVERMNQEIRKRPKPDSSKTIILYGSLTCKTTSLTLTIRSKRDPNKRRTSYGLPATIPTLHRTMLPKVSTSTTK
jgi:transposase InsO family protein